MSLDDLTGRMFGSQSIAEKPSFKGSEVELSDGVYSISLSPRSQLFRGLPHLTSVSWSRSEPRLSEQSYALLDVEGFYVGGMTRDSCTCGSVSTWVHRDQLSSEPGREERKVYAELGVESSPRIGGGVLGVASGNQLVREKVIPSNKGFLTLEHSIASEGVAYYPHRTFRVSAALDASEAGAVYHSFANLLSSRVVQKGDTLVAQDKGQQQGISFSYRELGSLGLVELTGIYVDVLPGKENAQVSAFIRQLFGG